MKLKVVLAAAALLVAGPVSAHEVNSGQHGGPVVEAGSHHVELVVKESTVDVFVTDASDKPVETGGFKGIAILTVAGKPQRIVLETKEGGRLSGTSPVALLSQAKGVVQLTAPNGKTSQGRFH